MEKFGRDERQPEAISFKAGLLDALTKIADSWIMERNEAIQVSANLVKPDLLMEEAYADLV